jgi:hypothetical protein
MELISVLGVVLCNNPAFTHQMYFGFSTATSLLNLLYLARHNTFADTQFLFF